MKIDQLLSGVKVVTTNEEKEFINHFGDDIVVSMLDEHQQWVAQNLVRKGIYSLSKDRHSIIKND
jgi:hypothetical protein